MWMSILRGAIGILCLVAIAYLFSSNRKAISWKIVIVGLLSQILLAVVITHFSPIKLCFQVVGKVFLKILGFASEGSVFIFGDLAKSDSLGVIFAFQILPTVVFFSALTSLLFYYGIIQKIVYVVAWGMTKLLGLSGPESLSTAGNIFLGQTESPLLIKRYLNGMSKSEIMLVMVGGMATISGGVLALYIGFLGGSDPVQRLYFAEHLLVASIMAAPGAVVASKILFPQTEEVSSEISMKNVDKEDSALSAIAKGTVEGVKLAVNIGAMILVFIALIALLNYIFSFLGELTGLNLAIKNFTDGQYDKFSLQFVLGYALAPLAWLIGVNGADAALVAQLLGEKTILNEFVAYMNLREYKNVGAFQYQKSVIIATYILCGFANFSSIGIQLGGIGTLAPNKMKDISKLGFKALLGGTLASLFSATIIGILYY